MMPNHSYVNNGVLYVENEWLAIELAFKEASNGFEHEAMMRYIEAGKIVGVDA